MHQGPMFCMYGWEIKKKPDVSVLVQQDVVLVQSQRNPFAAGPS